MLLVTVDVLKNSLTPDQKERLIEKVTTALVEIGSENTRAATWVRINEFESGDWAIGSMDVKPRQSRLARTSSARFRRT